MTDERETLPGLLTEHPILLYPSLAKMFRNADYAIIFQQLHFLLSITEKVKSKYNQVDGRWWVYNSYSEWQKDHFSWLSTSTIQRCFLWLEDAGIVDSMQSVKHKSDRRKWYSIDYDTYRTLYGVWEHWGKTDPSYQNDMMVDHVKMMRWNKSKCGDGYTETTTETTRGKDSPPKNGGSETGDDDGHDKWIQHIYDVAMGELRCSHPECNGIIGNIDTKLPTAFYGIGELALEPICVGCYLSQHERDDSNPPTLPPPLTAEQAAVLERTKSPVTIFDVDDGTRKILEWLTIGKFTDYLLGGQCWQITGTGRAALEAYNCCASKQSDCTVPEHINTACNDDACYCDLVDAMIVDDIGKAAFDCPICDGGTLERKHWQITATGQSVCDSCYETNIQFAREKIVTPEEKVGALCEVVEDEIIPTKPLAKFKIKARIASVSYEKASRPFDDDFIVDKPAPKLTPHTLMKNALVSAMGLVQDDITTWGEFNKASKLLRTGGATPEDIPALYSFTNAEARRKNYQWESPVKMAERWPVYKKQCRGREATAPQDESKPLDASEGVVRSEL